MTTLDSALVFFVNESACLDALIGSLLVETEQTGAVPCRAGSDALPGVTFTALSLLSGRGAVRGAEGRRVSSRGRERELLPHVTGALTR